MLVKRVLRFAAGSAAFSGFVTLLEQLGRERPSFLRVLTYHRVDEPDAHPKLYPGLISATPAEFDQQMAYLAAHYHVVPMDDVLESVRTNVKMPPRSVLVTFDDAYRDFAEYAWPIMKRYGLPVTLFVPTAYPDQPERTFWWDKLYQAVNATRRRDELETPLGRFSLATAVSRGQSFDRLKDYLKTQPHEGAMTLVDQIYDELSAPDTEHSVLSWNELRSLAREGVTLGAHTQTHPLMNRILPEAARAEAIASLTDLQREVGSVLPIFAYPSGGFNDEVVRILGKQGFFLAFTTCGGVNDLQNANRLCLRRINVSSHTTRAILRAKLLACSIYLNRWQPLSDS